MPRLPIGFWVRLDQHLKSFNIGTARDIPEEEEEEGEEPA
jgi:hypothetical protein